MLSGFVFNVKLLMIRKGKDIAMGKKTKNPFKIINSKLKRIYWYSESEYQYIVKGLIIWAIDFVIFIIVAYLRY